MSKPWIDKDIDRETEKLNFVMKRVGRLLKTSDSKQLCLGPNFQPPGVIDVCGSSGVQFQSGESLLLVDFRAL